MKLFLFISCLFACHHANAQGSNVYQKVFSAQVSTGASAVVRNNGQQYHRIDIFASGASCVGTLGKIFIEGSGDGVNYVPIGATIEQLIPYANATGTGTFAWTATTSAAGAYANVRVNYLTGFTVGCALTVFYVGTPTGTLVGSQPFTSIGDSFEYAVSSISTATKTKRVQCSTSGTLLELYAVALSATGGANVVTLTGYAGPITGSPIWTMNIALPAASPNWVQPQGSRPYYTVPLSAVVPPTDPNVFTMAIQLANATEVDYDIVYRCE